MNIRKYIDERLLFEYHKCLVGLDAIACRMSDILNNAESDSRDVLQVTSVKMQAYAMKIDLLSNAIVIEKAGYLMLKKQEQELTDRRFCVFMESNLDRSRKDFLMD